MVYVEGGFPANFVTINGDLYQNKPGPYNYNFNQFSHQSSASGPNNDVLNMVARVLPMCIYKYM